MSDGWGPLIVGVVGAVSLWGAWHYYDIGAAYTEQSPRELSMIGAGIAAKATEKGQLSYLYGNFTENGTKREFKYPITQQTFDQYQETAKELREPIMGHPYVPRPPLRMELNLSEKDIQPDPSKEKATPLSYLLFALSAICFFIIF